jgi:hypothetical protein
MNSRVGRFTAFIIFALVFHGGVTEDSLACVHMDGSYDRSKFQETSREALMWRDRTDPATVNLVLKSGLSGELPKDLAWVFPLPSVPSEYKEVGGSIFGELNKFFLQKAPQPRSFPPGAKSAGLLAQGIVVHEKQTVGDYEIVPIEITDEVNGGRVLNQWLEGQGYATMSEEIQRPYLKKGAAFLAIKVSPKSDNIELKPLLIRYRSGDLRFPLRFSHDDRTFDLNLYLVHENGEREISGVPEEAREGWGIQTQQVIDARDACPSLRELLTANPSQGDKITRIALHGANSDFMIRDLSEDPGI